jgi:formylglycine-generating enzyme required for sulfatase activity
MSKILVNPQDNKTSSRRVYRGGSWVLSTNRCRSALRNWSVPSYRYGALGFRVCKEVKLEDIRKPSGQ